MQVCILACCVLEAACALVAWDCNPALLRVCYAACTLCSNHRIAQHLLGASDLPKALAAALQCILTLAEQVSTQQQQQQYLSSSGHLLREGPCSAACCAERTSLHLSLPLHTFFASFCMVLQSAHM
jgi:hypothetical protein